MSKERLPEGTVTILFTDLVASTAVTTRVGDEAAQDLLRAYARIVRQKIKQHGGHEVKTMGDGFMVAFGSALRAVLCARDIQRDLAVHNRLRPDRRLSVRMGLNCAEATQEHEDFFGAGVILAERVQEAADGGQILATQLVKSLLDPFKEIEFIDQSLHSLAGFPEPWRLYEVKWQQDASVSAALSRALSEQTPFVGREDELRELRALVDAATRGRGRVVLLSGEPGLGKTRLVNEVSHYAGERGFQTLVGHCVEIGGAPPYAPFVEAFSPLIQRTSPTELREILGGHAPWLAKLLPEIKRKIRRLPPTHSLPPEQERYLLLNSVVAFVVNAARRKPLFLCLEDLQWADEPALLLLQYLARGIPEEPVVLVGTYRDVEVDASHPVTDTLAELRRRQVCTTVPLQGLAVEDVGQMLLALGGEAPPASVAAAIYGETEGNPLFVEEVVRLLADEMALFDEEGGWRGDLDMDPLHVPGTVRSLIARRLSKLSENSRAALTTAAVIGRDFDRDLLEAAVSLMGGELLDALDEARKALLVLPQQGQGARFTFAHELIRQTVYSELAPSRRQHLHLRVAEALEEAHPTRLAEHAAELAYHFGQAGAGAEAEKKRRYTILAAEQAMAQGAFEDAVRHYQRALDLDRENARERGGLLFKLGSAQRSAGRWDDAIVSWEGAASACEALGDIEGIERACYAMARLRGWRGQFLEAMLVVQKGLAAPGDSTETRCRLLALAGTMLSLGGQEEAAEQLIQQALTIARTRGAPDLVGGVLDTKGLHEWVCARFQESCQTLTEAEALLRSADDLAGLCQCLGNFLSPLGYLGRHDDMERRLGEFQALAERLGDSSGITSHAIYRGVLAMARGELDQAEQYALVAERTARESAWLALPLALQILGDIQFLIGGWDRAEQLLTEADALHQQMGSPQVSMIWPSLFHYRAFSGDREGARSLLPRLEELRQPMSAARYTGMVSAAAALVMLGLPEEAAEFYPSLSRMADDGVVFASNSFPLLRRVLGMVAAANGWSEPAVQHYTAALRQATELSARKEIAETSMWHARMLLHRDGGDDRKRGLRMLADAIEGYRNAGMPKHLEVAQRLQCEVSP